MTEPNPWQPPHSMPYGVKVEITGPRGAVTKATRDNEPLGTFRSNNPRYAEHDGKPAIHLKNHNIVLGWRRFDPMGATQAAIHDWIQHDATPAIKLTITPQLVRKLLHRIQAAQK